MARIFKLRRAFPSNEVHLARFLGELRVRVVRVTLAGDIDGDAFQFRRPRESVIKITSIRAHAHAYARERLPIIAFLFEGSRRKRHDGFATFKAAFRGAAAGGRV